MAKKAMDFKVEFGRPAVPAAPAAQPAAAPASVAAPAEPKAKPARVSVPDGCKSVTYYPSRDAWLQLRLIAGREGRNISDVMLDVLDAYLIQQGLTPNARRIPEDHS